jgi:protein-S-isoprenylcysteine O-methyltransferase Ste14
MPAQCWAPLDVGVALTPALAALVALEARAEERTILASVPDEYAAYRTRVPRFVGVLRG